MASLATENSFDGSIVRGISHDNLFHLLFEGFTTAVTHYNCLYFFNSHSLEMRVLSVADGTSVPLASLQEVENYIQVPYLEDRDIRQSYFRVQFINIDIDKTSFLNILSHYQRSCRSLNHQHRSEIINKKKEEVSLSRFGNQKNVKLSK